MTDLVTDPASIAAWYEKNRRALSGRGLWLLGGEPNTQDPAGFASARLRVLIVRLSEYTEVAAGLTHAWLYEVATGVDGVYADLACLPPARDEAVMRRDRIPLLLGSSSKRPASAFDLLAISVSVVQELVNLPALLAHSGIPLARAARARHGAPFVLLGGSNAYVTSILHGPVDDGEGGEGLVDGVIVGDGEDVFAAFLALVRNLRKAGNDAVREAARTTVPGFYDPAASLPVSAHRAPAARLGAVHDASPGVVRRPLFYHEEMAGSAPLLVSAGCPYFCSFCKESWEQKPYRERPVEAVLAEARRLKAGLGLSEVGLMTFNLNTCSGLAPLLAGLDPLFARVALKSQRFDALAHDPALLERQLAAGKRTYTCAMEGISDRIRGLLQKNLPEEVLLKGFQELFRRNIRQMKIFLIVTGWEEEADFLEFGRLLARVNDLRESAEGKPRLTFSFSVLFRPPRTPLQRMTRPDGALALDRLLQKARDLVRRAGFDSRVSAGAADAAVSEWLSYADRRATPRLVQASVERGFRYRGECGADLQAFLEEEPAGPEAHASCSGPAPWDDISVGVSPGFLERNRETLAQGGSLPFCLAPPLGAGTCQGCGACRSATDRAATLHWRRQPAPASTPTRAQAVAGPPKHPPLARFRVEALVPRRWADCGNAFLAAALARALMRDWPALVDAFVRVERTMPRQSSHGLFWADILVRAGANRLDDRPGSKNPGGEFAVLGIRPGAEPPDEPGCRLRLDLPPGRSDPAPGIDAFLKKYRWNHQKRWEGDRLTWVLQPGHAKKSGLACVAWPRGGAGLDIEVLRWPEPHVLPGLAGGDTPCEVLAFLSRGQG